MLHGCTVIPCTAREWRESFTTRDRRVAVTDIDGTRVSTVFLGLDHPFSGGPPMLFETLVFGGEHDGWQDRYSTWDAAMIGHTRAVKMVRGGGEQ
jgi:hypothetical protein